MWVSSTWVCGSGWNEELIEIPRSKSRGARATAATMASELERDSSPTLGEIAGNAPPSRSWWSSFWVPSAAAEKTTCSATYVAGGAASPRRPRRGCRAVTR